MSKARNWRHKFPEPAERKNMRAARVRLKPFGFTRLRAHIELVRKAMERT